MDRFLEILDHQVRQKMIHQNTDSVMNPLDTTPLPLIFLYYQYLPFMIKNKDAIKRINTRKKINGLSIFFIV
jgi:hypothetical protein